MLVVLDFDGVLFQRRKFKIKYENIFRAHGIRARDYAQTYRRAGRGKGGVYSPDAHIRLLARMYPDCAAAHLRRALFSLAAQSHHYIFGDARPFLRYWRKKKATLVLLSSGAPLFQKRKIRASTLTSFFQRVVVVPTVKKHHAFAGLMRMGPSVFFIDDTADTINAIHKRFPFVYAIQLRRRGSEKRSSGADRIVTTLAAATRVIASRTRRHI